MATWEWKGRDDALRRLEVAADAIPKQVLLAAHEIASYLEAYALTHHPWAVQTGATNVTTKGTVVDDLRNGIVSIVLSAGMDYDLLLETARSGRWAWLWPAIIENRDEIAASLQRHLRGNW